MLAELLAELLEILLCNGAGCERAHVVYFIQSKRDAEESRWEVGPKKPSLIRAAENPRSSHLTNKAFQ